MKVFLDTNVLLDVLAHREPSYDASARVWTLAERSEIDACILAISFNNVYYIVGKASGKPQAHRCLELLRDVFDWVAPDRNIINQAIDSSFEDFEDAVQYHSAIRARAEFLISRNTADFPRSVLAITTPEEFLVARSTREGDTDSGS